MKCLFFIMKINDSLSDLFHDFPALFWVEFANEFLETSIGAVLENDDQELFLFVKEELTGFEDVGMFEWDIQFSLIFSIVFIFLCNRNDFERVMHFVNGFSKVDFTKATFSKRFDENIVIDFLKHSFGRLNL